MKKIEINKGLLALLYGLVFILLREWLLPVMELTGTGYLSLFLLFIAVDFLLALTGLKWWLIFPMKMIYILWATHYIYTGLSVMTIASAKVLGGNIMSNFPILINGDWNDMTNPFRTILFFLLLWMMTYLIRYWIEVRKNIFIFFVMTVVFIAIIDTFSSYSATSSIFSVMVVGLLSVGLLSIARLAERHQVAISSRTFTMVSVPLILMIAVSGVIAMMLPKQDPVWADPVPYLKAAVGEAREKDGGEGVAKSGYSEDDSQLGGPFLVDDTLVFEARVEKRQYWKIETKDTYTSKGWEQSSRGKEEMVYYPGMDMEETSGEVAEPPDIKQARLQMTAQYPFIIYPYGMTKVSTNEDILILNDVEAGKYKTEAENEAYVLEAYDVEYAEQSYSLKALRDTTMSSLQSLIGFEEYLQLPDTLPERVVELAESITASHENVYDKTKAIERYFGSNGFVYDQKDVEIPGEDEDYVDQFLFETKRGYCDNYSSSMVVMLRTLGIPARWVKGFAPGENARNKEGERVYRVTNEEAHSWVEAYMPGIGWMPFEPTIGFDSSTRIDYDLEMDLDDPEVPEMPKEEREKLEQKVAKKDTGEVKGNFELGKVFEAIEDWIKGNITWILVGFFVLLLLAWGMFIRRRKWLPKVIVPMYRVDEGDWTAFVKQYQSLLNQLERLGLKRGNGETLLSYAVKVDRFFGDGQMGKLTAAYEAGIYGGETESQDWQRLQEMWEDLIIRTSD